MANYNIQLGKLDQPSEPGTIFIRNIGIEPPLTLIDKYDLQNAASDLHSVELRKMHGFEVRPDNGIEFTEYSFALDSFFDHTAEMADLQVRGLGALVTKILTDQGHIVIVDENFKEIGTEIGEAPYLFNGANALQTAK